MANLTHSELAEITPTAFPPASLDNLKEMRNSLCGSQGDFRLQSQQRFLRRVLSPDSPTRNLLAVHGTGVGKTCTAIQIAEEYILRPEFQDKRVLIITSPAVQENFQSELFRMDRVELEKDGAGNVVNLLSQQCTGRRYLDMLLRVQPNLNNWENPAVRERLDRTADRIIDEFYEFMGYNEFADMLNTRLGTPGDAARNAGWIAETFGNRLIIIDEAHNIREVEEGGVVARKGVTQALERLSQTAEGMVLVLLTATPMYDSYEEIVFYMNLFLWNDRKQDGRTKLKASDIFEADATLKPASEEMFRRWCQTYVSFVKGESPFTFPFRLPPPVVTPVLSRGFDGRNMTEANRLKYIPVVASIAADMQAAALAERKKAMEPTVAVLPDAFNRVFRTVGTKYDYVDADKPLLKAEFLPGVSAKFATVLRILEESTGVAMVYSNSRQMGSDLFAMALEEHGYRPVETASRGKDYSLMANPTEPNGKRYALLTPETPDRREMMQILRDPKNRDGSLAKVILTSPATSEGVDFRFIRQVHILDPWWNMSRMEQVAGRAMRTCSHQLLTFEQQNCTIYYHVVRLPDGQECYDEFTYRDRVVPKAMMIARVRKVLAESAMDCPLQNQVNTLPPDWRTLPVEQQQSQGNKAVTLPLFQMMAPAFTETPDVAECKVTPSVPHPDHVRPLSSYIDVRDEILNKLTKLFIDKPIWDRKQLFGALKEYSQDVVVYTLQNAISSGFRFKDAFNRPALLESHDEIYALAPVGVSARTMVDRTTQPAVRMPRELREPVEEVVVPVVEEIAADELDKRQAAYAFPPAIRARFAPEVLNGYVFDHAFTPEEKRLYLRTHADRLPFSNKIVVPVPAANKTMIVLGNEVIEPPEPLVGELRSAYKAWVAALIRRFIENKAVPFASLTEEGFLTISKLSLEGDAVVRLVRKRFEPIRCGEGTNSKPVMMALAKKIDREGAGVPKAILDTNKAGWCQYVELLAREQHNCFWLTPEELAVLFGNKEAYNAEFDK